MFKGIFTFYWLAHRYCVHSWLNRDRQNSKRLYEGVRKSVTAISVKEPKRANKQANRLASSSLESNSVFFSKILSHTISLRVGKVRPKYLLSFLFFFYCSPMKSGPWQAERNEKASLVYRLRQSTKDENMKTWKDACLWDIFSRQLWKECGRDALQVGSQLWRREMSAFFISHASSFEICFDQRQTLSVCQRSLTLAEHSNLPPR